MATTKTILIPTDFRVASLTTLKLALEHTAESQVDVVLLYCEVPDNSITELLFYSPNRIVNELMSNDFREALTILKNRFGKKINQMGVELFHGYAQSAFDSLLNTLNVDEIYYCGSYKLHLRSRAFDSTPFIVRGKIPYHKLEWNQKEISSEKDKLEALFIHSFL